MLTLLLVLGGLPGSARASEEKAVTIQKGEAAPFGGDLLPPRLSIQLGLRIERCEAEKEAEAVRATRLHEVQLNAAKERFAIQSEADAARLEFYREALEQATVWYRRPEVVATVTIVMTVAAAVATLYVYDALSGSLR